MGDTGKHQTIYRQFRKICDQMPDNEALAVLRDGRYESMSYRKLADNVSCLAAGLKMIGLTRGNTVAVMVDNGPEWVMIDLAAARLGLIIVPIHTTYNNHYVEYILNHADVSCLFVQDTYVKKISTIKRLESIRHVYVVGHEQKSLLRNSRDHRELLGHDGLSSTDDARDDDLDSRDTHTIVYTSGTTGTPKGVMLSHANLLSNAFAVTDKIPIYPSDRFLSFLPLSHILERTAGYYVPLFHGAAIYYTRGTQTLADDIKIARPTVLVCVPRVFEKVHEKILAKFSRTRIVHSAFKMGLSIAEKKAKGEVPLHEAVIWRIIDSALFHKVRAVFGDRLRFAVSGGASLPRHIAEFFEGLGIVVIEGYGLTETSPIVTVNTLKEHRFGTVGKPIDGVRVAVSSQGEILVRGDGLMQGYFKAPDITSQAIDQEGWFHTGDMGFVNDDGFLTINGRLKEMILLSTGRNIFPVPIEQELEESEYISQAMVYGDGQRAISAFIVPEFGVLRTWCKEQGVEYSRPGVLNNEKVLKLYQQEIQKMLTRFQSFEQVRHFKLLPKEFTQADDMLTPTLKLKRAYILNAFLHG